MIPKTIHCCWFGGPKTALAEKCRASWGMFSPDFAIWEWDAMRAAELKDLPGYGFFRDAIMSRRWAMASDWLRMAALWREGGVYLDYDVELVAGLAGLCENGAWVASEWTVSGMSWLNPGGGIALERGSRIAWTMLEAYGRVGFDDGMDMMPFINEQLKTAMLAGGEELRVLSPEVMSPIDVRGVCHRTAETRGIHHYAMSWATPERKLAKWLSWHGMRWLVELLLKARRKWDV